MAKVIVREGESIEQALRRFNREVQKEGILLELKKREYYEKPSAVKKREESLKKHRIELERLG
ncbi:MAG: 30S ribosomal protein S21 [bacterium]|nr:30S ribosomal protein S21 [bacterium]